MASFEMHIFNYRVLWFLALITLLGKTDSNIWSKMIKITGKDLLEQQVFTTVKSFKGQ